MIKTKTLFTVLAVASLYFVVSEVDADNSKQASLSYTVNMQQDTKYWGYLADKPITISDGESLDIALNIASKKDLDVVEIRLYNICNPSKKVSIGTFSITANGYPILPTIGKTQKDIPVYIAVPPCPAYGTTQTFVFDTDDSRGRGHFDYSFKYHGNSPLFIKTTELYIVTKNNKESSI